MRRAALIALAALPLLGFDCGGTSDTGPTPCTLRIAGAVTEQLWCIATVYDYSQLDLDPPSTEYAFELAAYRGATEVGAGVGFFLANRAATGTAYGWDSSTGATNVESGSATRYVNDADGFPVATHGAMAPFLDPGTGKFTVTFSSLPPPGAPPEAMMSAHGTLTATLPSTTTGDAVTLSATF